MPGAQPLLPNTMDPNRPQPSFGGKYGRIFLRPPQRFQRWMSLPTDKSIWANLITRFSFARVPLKHFNFF